MTSNMPTEYSFPRLARTLSSLFQSSEANFLNTNRLRPDVLVDEMKNKFLGGYDGIQHAVSRYIPHATPRTATPESVELGSQPDNDQQVTNTGREPEATLGHLLHNHNNPFTSEADDSEVEGSQPAASGENGSHEAPLIRPKRTWMWMAALIVGVLSLIVVPGLVVGVMTRQMSWGVELSGAIAPIVSFLAGLYYYYNK